MKWIKINPNHRPAVGRAIYSSFINPEDMSSEDNGTLYYVIDINEEGFTIESKSDKNGEFPLEKRTKLFIGYELILVTNLWVWDRHRENNYEIDDIYSN